MKTFNPVFNVDRVRIAISTNEEGGRYLHAGHLLTALVSAGLAKKHGLEFHLRIDDMYGKMRNDAQDTNAPGTMTNMFRSDAEIKDGNICKSYIVDMQRPEDIALMCLHDFQSVLQRFDLKFDRTYLLSDNLDYRDTLLLHSKLLGTFPFQFIEDILWRRSVLCRGREWIEQVDFAMWPDAQELIFAGVGRAQDMQFVYVPLLTDENGRKISKSNREENRYSLSRIEDDVLAMVSQRAEEILSTIKL